MKQAWVEIYQYSLHFWVLRGRNYMVFYSLLYRSTFSGFRELNQCASAYISSPCCRRQEEVAIK